MRPFWRVAGLGLALGVAVLVLYWPSLGCSLTGDDFQWLQHARDGLHEPQLLLADLDTMWRPIVSASLALDLAMWGQWATGYRLCNLALHALVALALFGVGRRCGLPSSAAALVAVVWALSPFSSEPACQVSSRVENLLLLSWSTLLLIWPQAQQPWSRWRLLAVVGLSLAACGTKETWVVTPALLLAAELVLHGLPWRRAWRAVLPAAAAVVVYAGFYVLVIGVHREVFVWAPGPLAKVPHELAAFFCLEELAPAGFHLTWRGLLALGAVAGLGWTALRRHRPAGVIGLALLVLPTLPTLFVPFLPTRYTAIAYAGFLLLLADGFMGLRSQLRLPWRSLLAASTLATATLVLTVGAMTVRGDLIDLGRLASAHSRLLAEAKAVAPEVPIGVPIVFLRAGDSSPMPALVAFPAGLSKAYFQRLQDPYALVDVAALFDWVLAPRGLMVRNLPSRPDAPPPGPYVVLLHRDGGFRCVPAHGVVGDAVAALRRQGVRFKLIEATPRRPYPRSQ